MVRALSGTGIKGRWLPETLHLTIYSFEEKNAMQMIIIDPSFLYQVLVFQGLVLGYRFHGSLAVPVLEFTLASSGNNVN